MATTQRRRGIAAAAAAAAGLMLAAPPLVSFLHLWEDGAKPFPKDGYVVYADRLAGGLPTTCFGMTRHVTTVPVVVGERWSLQKCEEQYAQAITRLQSELLKCFEIIPPQSVFDAATSHGWNNGAGNTCGSGAMRAWNQGRWLEGCNLLSRAPDGTPVWSYVRTGRTLPNGKPEMRFVQGLANRRNAETSMCKDGLK